MRKVLFLLAAALIFYAFPSCKTSWQCDCVITVDSNGTSEQANRTYTLSGPEQQARTICDTGTTSYTSSSYKYNSVCTLK